MLVLDVGVDLDGVVYPFSETLRQWLVSRGFDGERLPEPTCWDFWSSEWGLPEAAFRSTVAEAVRSGGMFRLGRPLPGAVEGLRALARAGHRIHFVTARVGFGPICDIEAATALWLRAHQLPHSSLTITAAKDTVRADVFLDVGNYEMLAEAGQLPFLYDQPWNSQHPGRRVRSWPEFVDAVTALTSHGGPAAPTGR